MRSKKGFTLIEIIAVVIIIGIIALIVVPSVSSYIVNARNTAYNAHEKAMEAAAQSMTIEVINGKDSFVLPKTGDHAEVYLNQLVEKEYLAALKDPNTSELCNESMSYVIIKNTGGSDYEYKACLYCGTYITDSDECSAPSVEDNEKPVCGIITGESSEWTSDSRTVSVTCSDAGSGCTRSKFTKVFNSSTDKGIIQISDRSGKTENCEVNVRVDKTPPTCELEAEGDENVESTGWSSGRTVVVKYKDNSRSDEHSGMLTYGIGTSLKNRNYNKQESYAIENLSGTTTVIGYVKDNAGNEGTCYKTVTTGLERPVFDIRYGYQIYPLKERFELSGATQIGDNQIKATNTTPSITFKNMSKYQGVTAAIIEFNSTISDPSSFKLVVGGNTYTASPDNAAGNRLRFYIETEPGLESISSKAEYTFKLGTQKDITYTITRIELEQKTGTTVAKHNVAVNLITRKAVVKTTKWSWDNGSNWDNNYYKLFDPTTGAKNGNAKVKNDIPLTSDSVAYSIVAGETTAPSITITSGNTSWTNQDITLTGKVKDTGTGLIGYMWSDSNNVHYYDSGWTYLNDPVTTEQTYTYTITKNGTYYLYGKDEAGNVGKKSITVTNIDKQKPTCSAIAEQASLSCSDPAATTDYGQSLISKYYWGTKSNPSVSDFKNVPTVGASFAKNEVATLGNGTRYYVFVIDQAGNRSEAKSDLYYTVTYDKNGDGTITKTSDIRRKTTKADLGSAFTATKNGYTFKGWHTSATATSPLSSYTVNDDATLYAVWGITDPTSVTLAGAATKIYGTTDTTITCTQNKTYAAGTTLYYSFGYSTTETGTPGSWTTAGTTNTLKIGKTDYYADRYYYCKIYAKNSYLTSETVQSNKQLVRYNNAKISFEGNTGTVNGTNPVYVRTGNASSFTKIRNNTTTNNPTASKSCYTFQGWYTKTSGGSKVLKDNGTLTGTAVSGFTSATTWTAIEDKTLYAQWVAKTYSVAYDVDKGTHGTNHPTTATYDTAFTVSAPSKSVKVTFSVGTSGATASSTADITSSYTFTGWKITGMDSVTHTYGSNTTSDTSIASTKATTFKNLLCNPGTVNFLALWSPPSITLPTITRVGYTCKWTSGTYEWTSGGTYTPSASGGATSRAMTAVCTPNKYTCGEGKYLRASDASCQTCPANSYCNGGTWTYNDADQGKSACTTLGSNYKKSAAGSKDTGCYMDVADGKYKTSAKGNDTANCTANNYSNAHTSYYGSTDSCTACTNLGSNYTKSAAGSKDTGCYMEVADGKYKTSAKGNDTAKCSANNYKNAHNSYYGSTDSCTACTNLGSNYKKSAEGSKDTGCYMDVADGKYKTSATGNDTANCTANNYKNAHTSYYGSSDSCTACTNLGSNYKKSAAGSKDTGCYMDVDGGKYKESATGNTTKSCAGGSYVGSHTSYYGSNDGCTACTTLGSNYTKSAEGSSTAQSCYMEVADGKYKTSANGNDTANCTANNYRNAHNSYYGSSDSCTACTNLGSNYTKSAAGSKDTGCYMEIDAGKFKESATGNTTKSCAANNYRNAHTSYYGSSDSCTACTNLGSNYTKSAAGSADTGCYMEIDAGKHKSTAKGNSTEQCAAGTYAGSHTSYYGSTDNCSSCPTSYPNSAKGSDERTDCYTGASRYQKKTTTTCNKNESYTKHSWKCTSNTTYSWGPESTYYAQDTCSNNTFDCDSSHSGQTYVSCTSNGSYEFSFTYYAHVDSCTAGTAFDCKRTTSGSSYVMMCTKYPEGDYATNIATCGYKHKNWTKKTWKCNSNTTYPWGAESVSENQSSCSANTFTCDSSHVNQTYVSCDDTSTYTTSSSTDNYATSCSTTTAVSCDSSHVGSSYVSGCADGDYYCSSGTLSGSNCYSP